MRTILSLFLAAVLALSSGKAIPDGKTAPGVTGSLVGANWEDVPYEHIDPAGFYEQVEQLTVLAEAGEEKRVLDLFDDLTAQLLRMDTMDTMAYLNYSAAVTDEYWSEENLYNDEMLTEAADALCEAAHDLTQGPCAQAFTKHVGRDAADSYADYVPLTDRESELLVQESELVDQYFEAMAAQDETEFEYDDRTWTFEMLDGPAGSALADTDYDAYVDVYYGLQKALNDVVGPIFTQLVAIRSELAEIEGYDSYADLAYEESFGRDYTGEEAQVLCEAVKEIGPDYYVELYYSDLWYDYDIVEPVMDADELLDVFGQYLRQVDEEAVEPLEYMISHGMYDIGAGEDRTNSAFTMPIPELGCPFLFMGLAGDCFDLEQLSHEFGHFIHDYYHPAPDFLTSSSGCFDLLEIHSTALEAMFTEFYDDIYTEHADAAKFVVLDQLMTMVLDGCIHDEFLRRIYAEPDMTLEEINELYAELCMDYGQYEPRDVDYTWMYVNHDFETPMYYISYAAASLASIQIWSMAHEDFQSGVDAWKAVMDASAYDDGYMTVLPACGLRLFTEEGAVREICEPLLEELDRLDAENR